MGDAKRHLQELNHWIKFGSCRDDIVSLFQSVAVSNSIKRKALTLLEGITVIEEGKKSRLPRELVVKVEVGGTNIQNILNRKVKKAAELETRMTSVKSKMYPILFYLL